MQDDLFNKDPEDENKDTEAGYGDGFEDEELEDDAETEEEVEWDRFDPPSPGVAAAWIDSAHSVYKEQRDWVTDKMIEWHEENANFEKSIAGKWGGQISVGTKRARRHLIFNYMRYAQGYGADLSTSHVQRFSRAVLGGKSIDRGEILRQFGDRDRGINNPGKTQMIELEHLMVSAREGLKELQRRCDETGVIEKKRYLQYTWERKKELEQQKKGKG